MKLFQKMYTLVGIASLLSSGITLPGSSPLEQLVCGRPSNLSGKKNDNNDASPSKRNKLLGTENRILDGNDKEVLKCLYKVPIFREARDLFAETDAELHNFGFLVEHSFNDMYLDVRDSAEQLVKKKFILEKMLAKLKKKRHHFPKKEIKQKVNERLQFEMVDLVLSIDKSVKEFNDITGRQSLNEFYTFVTAIAKDWKSQKLYSPVAVDDRNRLSRLIKELRPKIKNISYLSEKMKDPESQRSSQFLIKKIHVCLDELSENCSGDGDKLNSFETGYSCQVPADLNKESN